VTERAQNGSEAPEAILEYIGATPAEVSRNYVTMSTRYLPSYMAPVVSWARADYDFWRRAYHATARGLEVSGLFLKPLVAKVASWTLGRPPQWRLASEAATEALNDWWSDHHPQVKMAWQDALRLGDSFIVVNSDMTLTVVPPEAVSPIVADDDYGNIIGWRIEQKLPHPERPSDEMVIADEYGPGGRRQSVYRNGTLLRETVYPNLLPDGLVPVIPVHNRPEGGRFFGRPEGESLVPLLHRYGTTIDAALDGNRLQGRPTPVIAFESVADMEVFYQRYAQKVVTHHEDGTKDENVVLAVDLDQLLTVSGATFAYESPGSFSADTATLLELLFYMFLEHVEIPEFVLGSAVSSSKASAEAQMPVFVRTIQSKQAEAAGWLTNLAQVVTGYLSITRPGVVPEVPALQWPEIADEDGTLTLETVRWAFSESLLDRATALALIPIKVEDIDEVLALADEEREEREARYMLPEQEAGFIPDAANNQGQA
jgi:hypothetical protein